MEPDAVAELARWENERHPRAAGRPINTGLGAYLPLDGLDGHPTAVPVEPELLDVTAVGTVLIVRFRWPPDDQHRDLLLMVDFRGYPHTVTGASTWLVEYLAQHIRHDTSWFPRDLVPLSSTTAIVRPARQPGTT